MRDAELIEALDQISRVGGVAVVHAENGDIVAEVILIFQIIIITRHHHHHSSTNHYESLSRHDNHLFALLCSSATFLRGLFLIIRMIFVFIVIVIIASIVVIIFIIITIIIIKNLRPSER